MRTPDLPARDLPALRGTPSRLRTASLAITASIVLHALAAFALWQFGVIDMWIRPPVTLRMDLAPPAAPDATEISGNPPTSVSARSSARSGSPVTARTQHADILASEHAAAGSDLSSDAAAVAAPSAAPAAHNDASATTPAAVAGENERTPAEATSALQTHILDWLARYRDYPLAARRARLQGVVQVSATLMPDGRLLDGRIEQSSGHRLLDRAALDLLERASPVPVLNGFRSARVELHLPIAYRMSL
jgi:protein TonB